MEVDKDLLQKLEYIDDFNIKIKNIKSLNNQQIEHLSFFNLKGKEYRLIKNYNSNIIIEILSNKSKMNEKEKLGFYEIQNVRKKMNIMNIYVNTAAIVFMLRYLDMIFIVKRGGMYFCGLTLVLLYFTNVYFSKYKNYHVFKMIANLKKINTSDLLEKLKKENSQKYKDQILTKNALNKYWKEPMAWH